MNRRNLIRRMMLSMMAHPSYVNGTNQEFVDCVSIANEYLIKETKEYSIDIDKHIMIGVKCESEPILIGAVDGGGSVIDLDKIIVKEIGLKGRSKE